MNILIDTNMKRILFALMAIFSMTGNLFAQDKLYVNDVVIPKGESGYAEICLLSKDKSYVAFQFDLQLPAGISIADVDNDAEVAERLTAVTRNWSVAVKQIDVANNIYNVLVYNANNTAIAGNDGVVLNVKLTADPSLKVGEELADGIITNAIISEKTEKHSSADGTFKIEIVAPLVLDENSTEDIAETSVKTSFTVKRTIKANEWSTLCLPFDMTNAQVLEAFGSDVQFAELKAKDAKQEFYVVETDADDNVISITIPFVTSDIEEGIFANSPYLIKTSKDISSFKLSAQIIPEEAEAYCTNGKSGGNKETYVTFTGVYKAGGFVPQNSLFLSDNVFWYSTGKTKIKAFRAYFTLQDVLSSVENANAKISFSINDEATSIDGINSYRVVDGVYDLSGRKIQLENGDMNKLQKGVYIIDGKKVTIK